MTTPQSTTHGTYALYKRGCRCEACATYQRERVAKNRAERLASGRISHGTASGWDAGCRCESCGELKRAKQRRYYAAKKMREVGP